MIGQLLLHYLVVEKIGEGGQALCGHSRFLFRTTGVATECHPY
jgi:hypothetical protein